MYPQRRCAQAGQQRRQASAYHVAQMVAWGIEYHQLITGKQLRVSVTRQLFDITHLDIDALRLGDLGQQMKLRRLYRCRGDEQDTLRPGGKSQQGEQQRQQAESGFHGLDASGDQKSACKATRRLRPG